jgi:alginate O-acetyltransferase complex protein AlgI
VLLLIASLVFYAYGEPVYVLLMAASAACNYLWARLIASAASSRRKRAVMIIAVVQNLGVLGVFKYAGFAVSSFDALTGLAVPVPQITLPIGISFFTFQAMSYVIDVYRGEVEAQGNFGLVLLYICLFPQLIAGPIVKYHDIAAELEKREQTLDGLAKGTRRFIVGLAKKVLIANYMGSVADTLFAAPLNEINAAAAWMGAAAYALQIYFDFSGYSDMAIGLGWMFGFHFKENFKHPYISSTVREFWRRWHISLSTWFRDYLYIPLGGNRKGKARTAVNRIIVFFTCGLWHGASWTFVFWGLYHGAFMLLETYVPAFSRIKDAGKPIRFLCHVYLIVMVLVGWVFFRADTIGQGFYWVAQMFTGWWSTAASGALCLSLLTPLNLFVFACGVVASTPVIDRFRTRSFWGGFSWVATVFLLVLSVLSLATGTYNPFIYFRF